MRINAPSAALPTHDLASDKLQQAAAGFEAILVRQMLAAARKSGTDDSLMASEAQKTFRQMLDDHLADIAANKGVFGIGTMVKAHLSREGA